MTFLASLAPALAIAALPSLAHAQAIAFPVELIAPTGVSTAVARSTLQALSQLPPVTNVGYSFEYDPQLQTYVRSRNGLISGMVPAARFNRKGGFSGVVSLAYFNLDEFDGEDSSTIVVRPPINNRQLAGIGISSSISTEVYAVRLAGRYTILDNLDAGFSVPLLTVNANSHYLVQALREGDVAKFLADGTSYSTDNNTIIDAPLDRIDFPGSFNEGTNFDVGNVSLDAKYGFPIDSRTVAAGIQLELRLPTGSTSRFTGTDTTGLRGLLLASWQGEVFGAYFAGGYEQDFSTDVLSNGTVSASVLARPHPTAVLELGVNGNFYLQDIALYNVNALEAGVPGTELVAGDPSLGSNQVNFGGGGRYNLFGDLVLSGYGGFPVTEDGYRPDWMASLSLDYTF